MIAVAPQFDADATSMPARPLLLDRNLCQENANDKSDAVLKMSQDSQSAARVGANATMPDALPLNDLVVIGVMRAHDGTAALLRSSRGQIARVRVGDTAFGVQITAIGEAQVLLIDRWGRTQSLALPQS